MYFSIYKSIYLIDPITMPVYKNDFYVYVCFALPCVSMQVWYSWKSEEVIKNPATGVADSGELPGEELGIKPRTSGKAAVLLTTEPQCKHFKLAYKL